MCYVTRYAQPPPQAFRVTSAKRERLVTSAKREGRLYVLLRMFTLFHYYNCAMRSLRLVIFQIFASVVLFSKCSHICVRLFGIFLTEITAHAKAAFFPYILLKFKVRYMLFLLVFLAETWRAYSQDKSVSFNSIAHASTKVANFPIHSLKI